MRLRGLMLFLVFLTVTAMARAETMVEADYMDQQENAGGYVTRYLVTDHFLRMDFGKDHDDFVLFDRQAKRVYNVTLEQRQILVIEPGPVTVPKPERWDVKEDALNDERGRHVYEIKVNGYTCSHITASEQLLPEVAQALREFNDVMRATQAATYLATPAEFRHPCDLARLVLEPQRWLSHGLPLDEVNLDGTSRRLLNDRVGVVVRAGVFELPEGYRTVNLRDMQRMPKQP
jgi:hypothetical protein